MNVLVVAGSRMERQALVAALGALDHVEVQGAEAGLDGAVRAVIQQPPDLVVTSVRLEPGTALELVTTLRVTNRRLPIVVIGASPSRDEWRRHLEAGANRFVENDPELRELQDVVASLVHTRPASLVSPATDDLRTSLIALQTLFEQLKQFPQDESLWRQIEVAMDRTSIRLSSLIRDKP